DRCAFAVPRSECGASQLAKSHLHCSWLEPPLRAPLYVSISPTPGCSAGLKKKLTVSHIAALSTLLAPFCAHQCGSGHDMPLSRTDCLPYELQILDCTNYKKAFD